MYAIILKTFMGGEESITQYPNIAKDRDEVVKVIQKMLSDLTAATKLGFVVVEENEDSDVEGGISYYYYKSLVDNILLEFIVTKVTMF